MKVVVEDISAVSKKLTIEVSPEEVVSALKEAYESLKKEAEVEGFRKGKAPEGVLRQKFSKAVMDDVAKKLIEKTYPSVIKEKGLKPVSSPDIEVKTLSEDENSPFIYFAMIDVMPEFTLADYLDIEIERNPTEPAEDEVNRNLELLRERHAEFSPVERSASAGDMVSMDYHAEVDGAPVANMSVKDYSFIVGEGIAIFPEFDDVAVGAAAGEEREFEKSFPSGYHNKAVAGKEVLFKVAVKTVKEKRLHDLNDEFAKDLSLGSLDELKTRLREEISKFKEKTEKVRRKGKLIEKLIGKNPIFAPESLVNRYFNRIMTNLIESVRLGFVDPLDRDLSGEGFRKKYRNVAESEVKGDIILDAIADKENITATDEDLGRAVEDIARSRNTTLEDVTRRLKKESAMNALKDSIRREKVFDFLLDKRIIASGRAE